MLDILLETEYNEFQKLSKLALYDIQTTDEKGHLLLHSQSWDKVAKQANKIANLHRKIEKLNSTNNKY